MKNLPKYNEEVGGYVIGSDKQGIIAQKDATKGGKFVGRSHAEKGGIKVHNVDTDEPLLVEGGEIVLTVKASKDNCEKLSEMNVLGDGVAIPCDTDDDISGMKAEGGKTSKGEATKTINWEDINSEQQTDILENIYDNSYYLTEEWNIWTVKEYLDGEVDFKIPVIELDVATAKKEVDKKWQISEQGLQKVRTYTNLYPVISKDGKLFDGGHRIVVASERGDKNIDAYEISHLLTYDWEKFFEENAPLPKYERGGGVSELFVSGKHSPTSELEQKIHELEADVIYAKSDEQIEQKKAELKTFIEKIKAKIPEIEYKKWQKAATKAIESAEKVITAFDKGGKVKSKKQYEIKYVSKDRLHLKEKLRGSIKVWVFGYSRDEAIKKIEKEADFGELIYAKIIKKDLYKNDKEYLDDDTEAPEEKALYKSYNPDLWHLTLNEFLEYAENYDDKRLKNVKDLADFYKKEIVGNLLKESVNRNVYLLAIETGNLTFEKTVEIIKSAEIWDVNNRFISEILNYDKIRHYDTEIFTTPKDIFLSKSYYKTHYTEKQASDWYDAQIKKLFNEKEPYKTTISDYIKSGLIKYNSIVERLKESGNYNEENPLIKELKKLSELMPIKNKLKTFYSTLIAVYEKGGKTDAKVGTKEYKEGVNQIVCRTINKTIPTGEKIEGIYKIVSVNNIVASHNEETFAQSVLFPKRPDGKTVNDRDYEQDKNAQAEVIKMAQNLDDRTISNTPIVSRDGIVLDGNNRVMSRKLAATRGTDEKYLLALEEQAVLYCVNTDKLNTIKDPVLIFESQKDFPYTTETFKNFNIQEKKEKSPIEKAVEISKTISDKTKRLLFGIYGDAERSSEVTSNPAKIKQLITLFQSEKILGSNEMPRYFNTEKLTATKDGISLLESLLLGSALTEDIIRTLDASQMGDIKNKILHSIVQLVKNSSLGKDSIISELGSAIIIVNEIKSTGQTISDYMTQADMFQDKVIDNVTLALVYALSGAFKKFIVNYNDTVGKEEMFTGLRTKDDIANDYLKQQTGKTFKQITRTDISLKSKLKTFLNLLSETYELGGKTSGLIHDRLKTFLSLLKEDKEISEIAEKSTVKEKDLLPVTVSVRKHKSSTCTDAYNFVKQQQEYCYQVTFKDGRSWEGTAPNKAEAKNEAEKDYLQKYGKKSTENLIPLPPNENDFVQRLISDTKKGIKYNKIVLERVAKEYDITDKNLAKELAELSVVLMARKIALN